MRFSGNVFRVGRYWAIEVPILGVTTQGRSRKEAFLMIGDAIESLVNKCGFRVQVHPGMGNHFEVGSLDSASLTALLLKRESQKSRLSH